jgi:23S rRNA (pseudouridine1915-N3)-methyltransferase
MKITLLVVGKTEAEYLKTGINLYFNRIKHYITFNEEVILALKSTKNLTDEQQMQKEGELILSFVKSADDVILLDENGENFTSVGFAHFLEKKMIAGVRSIIFVIGGPYGFSVDVYKRADYKISLSKMTFSHQMVRLIFVEQIYRAMTILKGEPYHHQ